MRSWPIPVQMTGEDKTVGGSWSFRQLGYLLSGLALGGAAGFAVPLHLALRFLVYCIIQVFGVALAFLKINDTPLDVFLFRAWRWWRSQRHFYLRGDD